MKVYRAEFKPSKQLREPYVMAGVNVVAAESEADARRHFTSIQQQFTNLLRGTPGQLPPPIDDIDAYWSPEEELRAATMLSCSFVGTANQVREQLEQFAEQHILDELIVASAIYDHAARLRSYELTAK